MVDVTEDFPFDLPGRPAGGGLFGVNADAFDVAIGELPFLLYIEPGTENTYQRAPAPWRKDQFDAERNVGEQSLTGWWLRSQSDFGGGSGVTYYEPLLGEGSENRFRDSRGVDVLVEAGEVSLLPLTEEIIDLTASDVQVVASDTRILARDGGTAKVWTSGSPTTVTLAGAGATTTAGIAHTGGLFLIGHNTGIDTLPVGAGSTTTQLWNGGSFAAPVKPYWAKQRIFATSGRQIFELTLAGGTPAAGDILYEHPDPNWVWTGIAETGGAVWASGYSGDKSAVHVITIQPDGTTPTLVGATVGLQMPDSERVNAILGYLDFLIVGTTAGLRVAVTDEATASLGPLIFDDEPVYSVTGRGDYAWAGCGAGLTRKVALGFQIGTELDFAWANDLESAGSGNVSSLAWFDGKLCLGHASSGVWRAHATDVVPSGYLKTGFARFGTIEPKFFDSLRVVADCTKGIIELASVMTDVESSITSINAFNGARDVNLNLPGDGRAERLGIVFTLLRDVTDLTAGPVLHSYQVRAMPAPERKQRLIQIPLKCLDTERDRWGNKKGGPGFAWTRLHVLEALEDSRIPFTFRDFRTGEARRCVVESGRFEAPENPVRQNKNFGGKVLLTLRTID